MQELIGNTAGEIWQYLKDKGPSTPLKVKTALGISNTLLSLSLGWLAREGKIEIEELGQSYKISLKI
jgi:hypothetical protein